jgi:autotransporter-associated beta strand protein
MWTMRSKLKPRSIVAAAAIAALAMSRSAHASPEFDLQILGSTTQNGTYTSSLSDVAPGSVIYFNVVGQSASIGTTNSNTGDTPDGSTDAVSSLPTFSLSDGNGTFQSTALGTSLNNIAGGASAGTAGGSSLSVRLISTFTNDDSQLLLLTGSFKTGSVNPGMTATDSLIDSGIMKIAGSVVAITTTTGSETEQSNDPLVGYTPLTFNLAWSGGVNGSWDDTTTNFGGVAYSDGSAVIFGDTYPGGVVAHTNPIAITPGGVLPSSVTFTNTTANTYKFTTTGTVGIGGTGGVYITGGGTVIFASPNTYSGGTYISSGTLQVVNGGLLSTGAVTIGAAGKLAIGSGASLVPSALTTGAQTWTAGGTYAPKLDPGNAADLLNINGNLTLSGAGAFQITAAAGDTMLNPQSSESWEIANITGSLVGYTGPAPTAAGVNPGSQFALSVPSALFTNDNPSGSFSMSLEVVNGNDELFAVYNAAPEPGTGVLVLGGLVPFLLGRRRRLDVNRLRRLSHVVDTVHTPPVSPVACDRLSLATRRRNRSQATGLNAIPINVPAVLGPAHLVIVAGWAGLGSLR